MFSFIAGLKPGKALEEQVEDNLLSIRDAFLTLET